MNQEAKMNPPNRDDWEHDPVWNLVDGAKSPEPGPFFVRNVMREVRLAEESPVRWWQRLWTPKPILAGACAAVVAVAVLLNLANDGPQDPELAQPTTPDASDEYAAEAPIEVLLEEEMLFQAADNPEAFTDETLVSLLY